MTETIYSYTLLIPLVLFLSFLFTGLFGGKMNVKISGLIATSAILLALVLSYFTAYQYFFVDGIVDGAYPSTLAYNMTWLRFSDALHIDMGILLDPISIMMLVVITTISSMVHIYSFGYMKGDTGFARFYSFLSLFSFSMISLVIATNLFQMYIFWELVGVSSFLLIGYYYDKPSAVSASKKAFIVTRFADFGFLVGILLLSYFTGTFDFATLNDLNGPAIASAPAMGFMGISVITWAMTLIFIGGAGKSAMFPLHIWLPDAMEGPTPVSALIHAATMVVAGVFLVARLFPIYFFAAPGALEIVAIVGAFTSLFAAIIALTQKDIKRILAFSTMSQIGYMMMALGVSGYGGEEGLGYMAAMFHLFNHAMFKGLLFLGAGAIIHAVHSNNMTDMGNLKKYLPITHITFLIAALAISGIPPFSGFFSKDEILVAALAKNPIYFWIEWAVAGLTAFYMFRLYFVVFWGEKRNYAHTPHESPFSMTIPLMLLAIASTITGFIPFSKFISSDLMPFHIHMHWDVALPSILVAVAGIIVAAVMYMKPSKVPDRIVSAVPGIYRSSYNKFYIDEIYLWVTHTILFNMLAKAADWFDHHIIDGTWNGLASLSNTVSDQIKGLQSGQLQKYGMYMISGVLALFLLFIYLIS
jgi:NADH-quinone oxidoreductase subunit L